jgi:hypothetical protein
MRPDANKTGFPEFGEDVGRSLGTMLAIAKRFLAMGREMTQGTRPDQLQELVRQLTRTVSNSMRSVMVLVSNGCATDALKIARTMFETAVTVHYLDSHPEIVQDYVDFLWVKRKKHHDYLLQFAPNEARRLNPASVREMEAQYQRVKGRFTDARGKVRNSWHKTDRREIARKIGGESMYGGMYPFTSSLTHMDILGLIAATGESGDVEIAPSKVNLTLALQMAVTNYAMALTAWDEIGNCGMSDRLQATFLSFKNLKVE